MKHAALGIVLLLVGGIAWIGFNYTPEDTLAAERLTPGVEAHDETTTNRIEALGARRYADDREARVSDRFPNHTLTNHRDEQVAFYDDVIADKSSVIVFFYTNCNGTCPTTTQTLSRLRERLRGAFAPEDLQFVSLTLEPEIDTAEELVEYMDQYGIAEDPELADWIYLTGNFDELETIRRALGVYDLDPIIDADKTEHASIVTFGNDRTDRWAALPTGVGDDRMLETILRIAGNSPRQRYANTVTVHHEDEAAPQTRHLTGSND
jgi:protein SCO1/2